MKTLICAGIFLIAAGAVLKGNAGASGSWMVQSGIVLLISSLAAYAANKRLLKVGLTRWKVLEVTSFGIAVFLVAWMLLTGSWYTHPLGIIIASVGILWAFYIGAKSGRKLKKYSGI